ncbi:hypothetical protein, partial [Vibrio fluvialis]|uniref:hypothetical protein n=1 Tax=Vibrio fluvialis TaxID=676 RepID=UPI001EEBE348
ISASGALSKENPQVDYWPTATSSVEVAAGDIVLDASFVARTDTYTDTMGLFLDHYRVIPKGVFSYA